MRTATTPTGEKMPSDLSRSDRLRGVDCRELTRRRREKRTDYVVELPFGERTEYECPGCGGTFETTIHIPTDEPTFGGCAKWECDAFLKFIDESRTSRRSTGHNRSLGAFAGDGESE